MNRCCIKRGFQGQRRLGNPGLDRYLYSRTYRTFIMPIEVVNLEEEDKLCSFSLKKKKKNNTFFFLDYLVGFIVHRAHMGKHCLILQIDAKTSA